MFRNYINCRLHYNQFIQKNVFCIFDSPSHLSNYPVDHWHVSVKEVTHNTALTFFQAMQDFTVGILFHNN